MRLFFLIGILLPLTVHSQITFEKNIGSGSYEDALGAVQTADGGFIVCGRGVDSTGRYDILLLKTDSLGDSLWTKEWGGPSSDFSASIKSTADGGFVLAATTYSFSSQPGTNSDWWIFRFDSNGDTVWTRIINNIGNDRMYDAIETSDGSILACGWISSGGYARGTIRKLSSTGSLLHTYSLGSGGNSYAQSVVELPNGNYMLVGSTFQTTFGACLIELDTALNVASSHFYDLPSTGEVAQKLERLPQGGYMLTAKTGYVINRFDIWLLRLNDQFDTLWTRILPQRPLLINDSDEPYGFTAVADSGYLLCGQKLLGTSLRAIVYRLDTSGAIMWSQGYGGAPNDDNRFWWPISLADGGFLLAGKYSDPATFDANVYLVRTDAYGQQSFQTYVQTTNESGILVYPNPASDRLNWSFSISTPAIRSLELFTSEGRSVFRRDGISSNGFIDISNLPCGIYHCVMEDAGKRFSKRLLID
ncbi:MAG: T9SS type A sorting domain-containing protein [Bacteroidota bacterium]